MPDVPCTQHYERPTVTSTEDWYCVPGFPVPGFPVPGFPASPDFPLRLCRRQRKASVDELMHYADVCRVANIMRPYLEAML